jgi:hypothetical protein
MSRLASMLVIGALMGAILFLLVSPVGRLAEYEGSPESPKGFPEGLRGKVPPYKVHKAEEICWQAP